jgi:hypothetical protein
MLLMSLYLAQNVRSTLSADAFNPRTFTVVNLSADILNLDLSAAVSGEAL